MKSITYYISFALIIITTGISSYAQEDAKKMVTLEFKVSGVCNSCKQRIENAALMKGVKFAEWNKETQLLKVVYDTEKTTEDTIHKAIAKAGHDTEKVKATGEDYNKLPPCCAYRDGMEVH